MKYINIPKDGASDKFVTISELNFRNGDFVNDGEVVISYETSKASYELDSETSGYIYYLVLENEKVEVGTKALVISEIILDEDKYHEIIAENTKKPKLSYLDKIISKKAAKLIEEHKIDVTQIQEELVSEEVVQCYINKKDIEYNKTYQFLDNDIVIWGAGGHAGMCYDILKNDKKWNIKGFIDDTISSFKMDPSMIYFGKMSNVEELNARGLKNIIIGVGFIGNLKKREDWYNKLANLFTIPTITHISAIIEPSATIADGCQVMAGAIIGSNVTIDSNCIINSGSIVSHDSEIGKSVHLTPGVVLAGHTKIGSRTIIGMGTTVYIGVSIGEDVIVNNGISIFSDVENFSNIKRNE